MYEIILRMYKTGKLTDQGVRNAVKNSWITEGEAQTILSSKT